VPATKGPIDDLRREATNRILKRMEGISVTEGARNLGVSRQAIYDVRRGQYCFSIGLIERACEVWPDFEFTFRGLRVGKNTLRTKRMPATAQPAQADLFEMWRLLENQKFQIVQARRVGKAMELVLRIDIPA
jgi:hypothetical protein